MLLYFFQPFASKAFLLSLTIFLISSCEVFAHLSANSSSKDNLVERSSDDFVRSSESHIIKEATLPGASNIPNCVVDYVSNEISICFGLTYYVNGNAYSSTGVYTDTLTNVVGCDSIVTTDLTVIPFTFSSTILLGCEGEPLEYNGETYTTNISTSQTFNSQNCFADSTVSLSIFFLPPYDATVDVSICEGESYLINGTEMTDAGTYFEEFQTVNGCDSTITTILSVSPVDSFSNDVTICEGESYFEGTSEYTANGTFTDTYQSVLGCDSIVITNLTVNPSYVWTNDVSICEGESYFQGTSEYQTTGAFTDTYQSVLGCDSVIITNLTVNPIYYSTNDVIICDGESYYEGTSEYTTSGTFIDMYQSAQGCDSVIITNLTIISSTLGCEVYDVSICDGEEYLFYGFTTAGTYVVDGMFGAPFSTPTQIFNLTVDPTFSFTNDVSICEGESYYEGTAVYNAPGTFTATYQSVLGCDSVIITNLTFNPVPNVTNDVSICEGESYIEGTSQYTTTGTYTNTYTTALGCDSTVTTVLTVNPVPDVTNTVAICQGDIYTEGTSDYTVSGTFTNVYSTPEGCEYYVTTVLTVNDVPEDVTNNVEICEGETYTEGTSNYSTSGTYTDTYATSQGCDYTVTTVLTVNPVPNILNNVAICEGETYAEGTSIYNTEGTYTDQYTSPQGCPGIVTTVLTVNSFQNSYINNVSICDGESHFEGSSEYTTAGTYTDTYQTILGCDSVIITNLTVNPVFSTTNNVSTCDGVAYFEGASEYTVAGTYIDTYQSVLGCDSVIITNLTVVPIFSTTNDASIYEGESYYQGASEYTTAGTYTDTYQSIFGCDSVIITNLTVNTFNCTSLDLINWSNLATNVYPTEVTYDLGEELLLGSAINLNTTWINPDDGNTYTIASFELESVSGLPLGIDQASVNNQLPSLAGAGEQICLTLSGSAYPTGTYQVQYSGTMTIVIGSVEVDLPAVFVQTIDIIWDGNAILGCTYFGAANYNPVATAPSGQCIFEGCTDPTAINFVPSANQENGSCLYGDFCMGDFNGDGIIGVGDLSNFLSVFGLTCEP